MTKKDYILIAESLKDYKIFLKANNNFNETDYNELCDILACKLKNDNVKFTFNKWEACLEK